MRCLIVFLTALLPMQAIACDEVMLACTVNGARQVTVCLSGQVLTYAYGKAGAAPELQVTAALSAGAYTPWNGFGRYISDSITFHNVGHSYEVWQSIDKMATDAGPVYGVNVLRGHELINTLVCDEGGKAQPFDRLYEATEAQGLCWDFERRGWQETCP